MRVVEEVIKFLQFEMEKPTNFGWFHILCLIVMLLIIFILYKKRPNLKKFIIVSGIVMISSEVYKQLSFSYSGGIWKYQWYAFPFQFCDTPMYVALVVGITKNKRLEDILYSYLTTYGLVAGVLVMLYPNTVFVREVLIDIGTMVHHGLMVVMGVYVLICKKKVSYQMVIDSAKVFIILVGLAMFLNILTYYVGIDNGLELFYISPYHVSTLPILNIIYENVPYLLFLLIYLVFFTLGAFIPIIITKKIKRGSNEN